MIARFVGITAVTVIGFASAAAGAAVPAWDHLTLSAAQEAAREYNRDIRAARRAIDGARAAIVVAGARPNPAITTQVSNINPRAGIGSGSLLDKTVDTQLRIDYPIERGGKRELRIDTATHAEKASRADLVDTVRLQASAVANAYVDLLLAQRRAQIATAAADLAQRTLEATETRFRAGDVSATDVTRIRIDSLRARTDAQVAEADRLRAQSSLALLLGAESRAAEIVATDDWPDVERGSVGSASDEEIVERRPDVQAAIARVAATESARRLARSLTTRDVSIGVTYDHWPSTPANPQGSGNSFGIAISVPLFLGNDYRGEIAKAEVDYGAALDQLERVRATALVEIRRARNDLAAATQRLQRLVQELAPAARAVAEAQDFAYRNGAIGVLDLLDAQRAMRAVELDVTSASADRAKAMHGFLAACSPMGEDL